MRAQRERDERLVVQGLSEANQIYQGTSRGQ